MEKGCVRIAGLSNGSKVSSQVLPELDKSGNDGILQLGGGGILAAAVLVQQVFEVGVSCGETPPLHLVCDVLEISVGKPDRDVIVQFGAEFLGHDG